MQQMQPGQLGKVGAIFNIVSGVIFFWLIYPIFTIIFSLRYLKTGESKTAAGVLGIFTSGLGGLFILLDNPVPATGVAPAQPTPTPIVEPTPKTDAKTDKKEAKKADKEQAKVDAKTDKKDAKVEAKTDKKEAKADAKVEAKADKKEAKKADKK